MLQTRQALGFLDRFRLVAAPKGAATWGGWATTFDTSLLGTLIIHADDSSGADEDMVVARPCVERRWFVLLTALLWGIQDSLLRPVAAGPIPVVRPRLRLSGEIERVLSELDLAIFIGRLALC